MECIFIPGIVCVLQQCMTLAAALCIRDPPYNDGTVLFLVELSLFIGLLCYFALEYNDYWSYCALLVLLSLSEYTLEDTAILVKVLWLLATKWRTHKRRDTRVTCVRVPKHVWTPVACREGCLGGFKPSPPRNSKDPRKSCQTQPDCENC